MARNNEEVWVIPKGSFYAFNTHCGTLKEAMQTYPSIERRSMISSWWKNPVGYDPLQGS